MPCCIEERYQKSMEDITWNMCSTPLLVATSLDEEDVAKVDLSSRTRRRLYEKSRAELAEPQLVTFDDYFYRIQRELEECRRLKKRRNHYLLRLINAYERDCMLEKWDTVESRTDELERKCVLYRKIVALRKELLDISAKVSSFAFNIEDSNQLEQNVLLLKNELDHVNDKKAVISDYNFQVHQLSKDSKYSSPPLTEDINDLYRIWEETHQKIFNQLTNLQKALWTWRQFDIHMLELKTVLREDHTALNVLDRALKQEQCNSEEVALTVKNIAKYLPDKHHDNINKINCNSTMLDNEQIDGMSTFLMNTLHVEGSFSDSGISDSGSEQDMCERERKLALLKKLARHLEALLAPGSDALRTIIRKIDEAEEEIRELQQTCRTIMKTGYLEKEDQILLQLNKSSKDNFQADRKSGKSVKSGDPESDPHRGRSIFWRILRASLPFHMAFVVLLFVAYLLEPNCCDAINNLNLSLTPQLRYISGPPPT